MTRYLHVILIETEKDNADLVAIAEIIHAELVQAGYAKPIVPPVIVPPLGTPFVGTRQSLINLFFVAFGRDAYIALIHRAGLDYIFEARQLRLELPALEDLPGLTRAEKESLIRALAVEK